MLYPECAVIVDSYQRKTCCDTKVVSSAGREFCYSQMVHPEGTFNDCESKEDLSSAFDCCEEYAGDDKSLAFDCKSTYRQDDCTDAEQCKLLL